MTKSKSQLRAEAVERLRKINCMDVDCYQLLEAVVDDAGEKVGYRVEISKLIDLLTDDAHESRGSYEERLHDVPVSDCPYCGCKRVVIHGCSEIYENPHSYRVEHVDEKEAFEAGCFETYYAFDSVEKAVEHANMRDPLTDEPMDAQRDSDGTCPDTDRTASIERSNDGVAKLDAQARAEIEDAERSANAAESHGGAQRAVLSADTDTDKGEGVKAAQDTREKLEADVRRWFADDYYDDYYSEEDMNSVVFKWLDRQAAITQDETIHDYNIAARESGRILRDEIAELQADRDELQRQLGTMRDVTREFRDERAALQEKVDALEAEKRECMEDRANRVSAAIFERDRYREKLGRAIDAAHEIVRIMEVER